MKFPIFANKLAESRRNMNMTQKDLAEAVNVHQGTVSRWESGRAMPPLDMGLKLIDALRISQAESFELFPGPMNEQN